MTVANSENNTSSNELTPANTANSGSKPAPKQRTHWFSSKLAKTIAKDGKPVGWKCALVFQYLVKISNRSGNHRRTIDGKTFVRVTVQHIADQYPYLVSGKDKMPVWRILQRLEAMDYIVIGSYNKSFGRPSYERNYCIHIPHSPLNLDIGHDETKRLFNVELATKVGVPAAAIYANFCDWFTPEGLEKRKKHGECLPDEWMVLPSTLTKLFPFSETSIKRAIKDLVAHGLIDEVGAKKLTYKQASMRYKLGKVQPADIALTEAAGVQIATACKQDKGSKSLQKGSKSLQTRGPDRYSSVFERSILKESSKKTTVSLRSTVSACGGVERKNIARASRSLEPLAMVNGNGSIILSVPLPPVQPLAVLVPPIQPVAVRFADEIKKANEIFNRLTGGRPLEALSADERRAAIMAYFNEA